jgi:hypothetical protein
MRHGRGFLAAFAIGSLLAARLIAVPGLRIMGPTPGISADSPWRKLLTTS